MTDAKQHKRKFSHQWLDALSPSLAYSRQLKGAFCKYYVLFSLSVRTMRGGLGSFFIRPFIKDMHDYYKAHVQSQGHQTAMESAKSFTEAFTGTSEHPTSPVFTKINKKHKKSTVLNCLLHHFFHHT